ncbi:MAG: TIGR02646 family protein [Muribaculaceae bacterium]|nr:TIGR02646 family protein [Muribaculaceae bacterium]
MHRINKAEEDIQRFNTWAKSKHLRRWVDDFSGPRAPYNQAYKLIRANIVNKEQKGLSAYTEKPLGQNIHIDHFRNRDIYPNLMFDYANMLVDDRNDNYGAYFKDNHSGVKKDIFDGKERIFCPVTENMADFITFMFNGEMIAKLGLSEIYTARVNETIRVFNLNHKTLKDIRRNIINLVIEYRKMGLDNDEVKCYVETMGYPSVVAWALSIPLEIGENEI